MQGSGTSGARRAEAARRKAQEHALEAEKWQRLADAYEKGDAGEQHVAGLLDVLDGAGWVVLNDRYKAAGSPANIDHILVGPPGVCVIDAKNWAGRVAVDAAGLTANGRRRDEALHQAHEQARLVGEAARQSVPHAITAPALCFVGDVGLAAPIYEHGVVVLQADQLLAWLTSLPHNLQPQEVARLGSSLSAHFWPRTEPRPGPAMPFSPRAAASPRPRSGTSRRPVAGRAPSPRSIARDLMAELKSLLIRVALFILAAVLCLTLLPKVLQSVFAHALPTTPATPAPHATPRR